MKKSLNKYVCLSLLFIPIFLTFTLEFAGECDIWFLLNHGRYVLNYGFPHVDFMSMHSNLHFVMQQWLSAVIFYGFYKLFGFIGVYFVVWISNLIIILLIYKLSIKISDSIFLSCIATVILSILLQISAITCRPFIFSFIIFLLLLYIMESYRKKKSNIIWYLVLLSLFQVNLHASMWPVLFILLLPYLANYLYLFLKNKDKTIFKLILIVFIMIMVGFINPYGLEAMTYSFRSYGVADINETIWEMNGLNLNSDLPYVRFFAFLNLFVLICTCSIFILSKKKVEFYRLLLFFGTYMMALMNIRNVNLFFICSIPFCTDYIKDKIKYKSEFSINYKLLFCLFVIITIAYICLNNEKYVLSNSITGQDKVLSYMEKNVDKNEPIYTVNTNGGFIAFYGYKPYIDTRAEVYLKVNNKKEDIFHEFYLLMNGKLDYDSFLKKYNFKYLLVDKKEPMYRYLNSKYNKDYHLVYKNKKTYLYEKNN